MTGVKGQMGSTVHWDIFFASSALTISHDSGVVPKEERPVQTVSNGLLMKKKTLDRLPHRCEHRKQDIVELAHRKGGALPTDVLRRVRVVCILAKNLLECSKPRLLSSDA